MRWITCSSRSTPSGLPARSAARAAAAGHRDREERLRLERVLAEVRRERPQRLERLLVETDGRVLLPVSGVERIEAARNYVTVHAGGRPYRLRTTLDRLEERLDPGAFVRVHRSTIVGWIRSPSCRAWSHGDYVVVLQGGAKVRLSRRYRDRLQQFLP